MQRVRYCGFFKGEENFNFEKIKEPEIEIENILYTAEPIKGKFLEGKALESLPKMINGIYAEVKTSFIHESPILAGIGLRTLIEAVCVNKSIGGNDLNQRINRLHADGYISPPAKEYLHKLRKIGNASTHKIQAFSMEQLSHGLEIANHLLKEVYFLPKLNKKVRVR